jgi:hypothetical protein
MAVGRGYRSTVDEGASQKCHGDFRGTNRASRGEDTAKIPLRYGATAVFAVSFAQVVCSQKSDFPQRQTSICHIGEA